MKKFITVAEAVSKLKDGMTIMIGGFLAAGSPKRIIDAMVEAKIKDIILICNDTAYADKGIGLLVSNKQVKKIITSHIGTNTSSIEQFNNKELEIEFVPQGTLAERIRAAGAGLGGILTPTGVGTVAQEGKQIISLEGKDYLLEKALKADVALICASIADTEGNLYYKGTTHNFNPLMATAAELVIAEVGEVVEPGEILMENVHTQALFVDYMVKQ